jgi:nickel/cobalt transporter (NiCoT) family protein
VHEPVLESLKPPAGGSSAVLPFLLASANVLAWIWAWQAFANCPALLGLALLAWGFGLCHAVDADHIAAIDNVVRKLMQGGQRPVAVAILFSDGHSAVVVLASRALAVATATMQSELAWFHGEGGSIGTAVAAGFLLVIVLVTLAILCGV